MITSIISPNKVDVAPRVVPLGVDSETHLIQAGNLTPPLVVVSTARRDELGQFKADLRLRDDARAFYHWALAQQNLLSVIHNAPFDLAAACVADPSLIVPTFDAYQRNGVCCTIVLQKLIDVAFGMRKFRRYRGRVVKTSYELSNLVEMYYGEEIKKDDTWRKSYALLDGVPLEKWPPNARQYAAYDAVLHLRVWEAQQSLIADALGGDLPNQLQQQRAAWVLYLMGAWGIRAEKSRVDYFVAQCEAEIRKMHERLFYCLNCGASRESHVAGFQCTKFENTGIFKWNRARGKPSRVMEEIRRRVVTSLTRMHIAVPMTDPSADFPLGQVQTNKDTLLMTDDPYLHVLAEAMKFDKHLGQWGPVLRAAVQRPVCCRYEVLRETGRTACSGSSGQEGTNIQNPPRKGDVRPAIVPRSGWGFVSTDADTIELRAHAQNCLELVGWSKMAEALLAQARTKGPDLHEVLGARLVNVSPEEMQVRRRSGDIEMIDARQFAKIPNFGFPGGLGAETFVAYAAGQLAREAFRKWLSDDRVTAIKKAKGHRDKWFETFPENDPYFTIVGKMIDRTVGHGTIRQLMSGRIRGGVSFTAAANGFFQGRVADAMKDILWRLAYECYTGIETDRDCRSMGRRSILFGSRPVMFLHDEPILEHPLETIDERAERQREIVVESLSKWMPDIPCTSSAVAMLRWQKGAEPLFLCLNGHFGGRRICECGQRGKLVPVKPEKVDGKVLWLHDSGGVKELVA